MKSSLLLLIGTFLLALHSCQHPDISNNATNGTQETQLSRVGVQYQVNWAEWGIRGISWTVANLDGTRSVVIPLKFTGKKLPAILQSRVGKLDTKSYEGLVNMIVTLKDSTIINRDYLLELPDKYKENLVVQTSTSPGGRRTLSQTVCVDHSYQTCYGDQCGPVTFSYRDCATIEYDEPVSNNPGVVTASGGYGDGDVFANKPDSKHETNQRQVYGSILCRSFPVTPYDYSVPGQPTQFIYEVAVSNLILHYANGTSYTITPIYISVPRYYNSELMKAGDMMKILAAGTNYAALITLSGTSSNPTQRFADLLENWLEGALQVNPDRVTVRTWNASDGARGLYPNPASYRTPYTRVEDCGNGNPD